MPRRGRAAWWKIATALTVVGAAGGWLVLGTGRSLLLVALVGGLVTLGCWQLRQGLDRPHPSRPEVMCGLLSGITALAVIGWVAMFGSLGWWLTALVAAVGWWVLRRPDRAPVPSRQPSDSAPRIASNGPAIEALPATPWPTLATLPTLSTPQLCWIWRVSYGRIQRSTCPSELSHLAEIRNGCLAELQHRDPAGFARWFPTARAASDPARFFCARSPEAATPAAHTAVPEPPATPPPSERSDGATGAPGAGQSRAAAGEQQRGGTAGDPRAALPPTGTPRGDRTAVPPRADHRAERSSRRQDQR